MTKTDHIKAILELLKLFISSLLAAIFLLLIYQLQYPEKTSFVMAFGYVVLALLLLTTSISYKKMAKELDYAEIEQTEKESQKMESWWQFWK